MNIYCTQDKDDYIKELFPEAFESEVKSLPKDYTGWCRCSGLGNEKWIGYFENGTFKYGISAFGEWFFNDGKIHNFKIDSQRIEATEQEVFEALKNEAVKRGFVEGCYFIEPINQPIHDSKKRLAKGTIELFGDERNKLCFKNSDSLIYREGVWGKAFESITLSEAEQQLGKKIIV